MSAGLLGVSGGRSEKAAMPQGRGTARPLSLCLMPAERHSAEAHSRHSAGAGNFPSQTRDQVSLGRGYLREKTIEASSATSGKLDDNVGDLLKTSATEMNFRL